MIEQELIYKCQKGELECFGDLYTLYINKIYKFIYLKTGNSQIAEDLTSATFLSALDNISRFKIGENSSFQAWIYRIAYNKTIDFYRIHKEEASLDNFGEFYKEEDFGKQIDDKVKLEEVIKFLEELKPEHREIFIMRIWYDLSYNEIAEITEKTQDNCKQIFSRTLKKINANLMTLLICIILL